MTVIIYLSVAVLMVFCFRLGWTSAAYKIRANLLEKGESIIHYGDTKEVKITGKCVDL